MTSIRNSFCRLILLLALTSCSDSNSQDVQIDYDSRMKQNLDIASRWIIEFGHNTFNTGGRAAIINKLADDWGVTLRAQPVVNSDFYIARFLIQARRYSYEIVNLYQLELDSEIYEYWIVNKTTSLEHIDEYATEFYIARTSGEFGKREIVAESSQFIESYPINSDLEFKIPVQDLGILYKLQAWKFPNSYLNSDLDEREIIAERSADDSLTYSINE